MRYLVILIGLSLVACDPDKDLIRESFAYLKAGDDYGSGFYIGGNIVATACHVVDEPMEFVEVTDLRGNKTIARSWECHPSKDIAFLYIDEDIFEDNIDIVDPHSGLRYGCFAGRETDGSFKMTIKCRMSTVTSNKMTFTGGNATKGMSGGPCVVVTDSGTYATGAIARSYQSSKYEDGRIDSNWGLTVCETFDQEAFDMLKGVN